MAELGLGGEAINVWNIAAKNGSAEACYNLAMCYANGEHVLKNFKKVVSKPQFEKLLFDFYILHFKLDKAMLEVEQTFFDR